MAKEKKKEEAPPPEDGVEGEAPPKKKGLPIMMIAIIGGAVLVLGGGGAAAYFLFLAPKPEAAADAHGAKPDAHGENKDDGHGKKDKKKEEGGGHGGGGDAKVDPKTQPVVTEGPDGVSYYTLPDTLTNIQSVDGKPSYLKLKLTFECADEETIEALNENKPRIDDVLNGFLGELRPEDLTGSQGDYQLRLEILRRVNLVLGTHKIKAVLIQEKLIS